MGLDRAQEVGGSVDGGGDEVVDFGARGRVEVVRACAVDCRGEGGGGEDGCVEGWWCGGGWWLDEQIPNLQYF